MRSSGWVLLLLGCTLLLSGSGVVAFMPTSRTLAQSSRVSVAPTAAREAIRLPLRASEGDAAEATGLDKALISLGFKKEAGEATRTWKDQLKSAGLAGVLSYVSSEVLFWVVSLPLGVLAYHQSTGEWLDLSTADGQTKVAGFSAGFLAFARLALPVRGAVALALTPALDKYVVRPLIERGVVKEQGDQQE